MRRSLKSASKDLGVVIVNWNTSGLLERCIRSFLDDGVPRGNVVVVDNGSTDDSHEMVRKKFRGVRILVLGAGNGYGSAANRGASLLRTPWLVVANADIQFQQGTLRPLIDFVGTHPNVALVGPRVFTPDGVDGTRYSAPGALRSALLLLTPVAARGIWRRKEQRSQRDDCHIETGFIEGCFMLFRRSAYDEVGGFDPSYSFYFEDADIALRLRRLGHQTVRCAGPKVTHWGGASFSQRQDGGRRDFFENCLRFFRRHRPRVARNLGHFFRALSIPGSQRARSFGIAHPRNPGVSVIIPTVGRPERLRVVVDGLKRQSYPPSEIIIVDQSHGRSTPSHRSRKGKDRSEKVFRMERQNRAAAKNLGASVARNALLLFLDDDVEVPDNLIEAHVRAYLGEGVGAVSCRVLEPGSSPTLTDDILRVTWFGRLRAGFDADITREVGSLVGGNMSIPRDVWNAAGPFDASLAGTSVFEEPDISHRIRALGMSILFTNAATVKHYPQADGNAGLRSASPDHYYRWFHHNEMLYFLKNENLWMLLPLAVFSLLRSFRTCLIYGLSVTKAPFMIAGLFEGRRTYRRLYKFSPHIFRPHE